MCVPAGRRPSRPPGPWNGRRWSSIRARGWLLALSRPVISGRGGRGCPACVPRNYRSGAVYVYRHVPVRSARGDRIEGASRPSQLFGHRVDLQTQPVGLRRQVTGVGFESVKVDDACVGGMRPSWCSRMDASSKGRFRSMSDLRSCWECLCWWCWGLPRLGVVADGRVV